MNAVTQEVLSRVETDSQLITRFDSVYGIVWLYMRPAPRPCFTPRLLQEVHAYQEQLEGTGGAFVSGGQYCQVRYQVLASRLPGVFNLGGDLQLFSRLIQSRDRDALYRYAKACIDVLYPNAVNYHLPITTISLVQGEALGGGFEAALSSNVLIAERSAKMGLPEVLFNLFPGMGAYSLLARRLDRARAEQMILSGRIYSAEELYDMGVVDVLAEDGAGEEAVYGYIRKHKRMQNTYQAIQKVRQRFNPVTYDELMDITAIWVDAALRLEPKDLRVMERLVKAQDRLREEDTPALEDAKIA